MVRKILIAVVVLLVLMQFVRPERENPTSDPSLALAARVDVPPDVAEILTTSCFDCHSNETVWPWYSGVAPVSWLVAHDVEEGREHLNFSTFGALSDYRAQHKLEEVAEEVGEGEMPLKVYLPAHPEARLSDAQRARLVEWANAERAKILESMDPTELRDRDERDGDHDDHEEHEEH